MRKGIKVVTGMLAGLFILGAGMQAEAGFNLGKALGNIGVKTNVPAVGNSGAGMTLHASCDLPYAYIRRIRHGHPDRRRPDYFVRIRCTYVWKNR